MTYVIAAYLLDESRKIQLWTCVHSIMKVCRGDDFVLLIYSDVDENYLSHLNGQFPSLIAIRYPQKIDYGFQKISKKTELQSWYISNIALEGEKLCLLDFDTLVLSDTSDVFKDKFDIAYTIKSIKNENMCPVNCGVMYVVKNESTDDFFCSLSLRVSVINKHEGSVRVAESTSGGIGQHVFLQMIKNTELKLFELCDIVYNMHHNWQLFSKNTKIAHMKGGMWRRISTGGYNHRNDRYFCKIAKFYLNMILESGYSVLIYSDK